MPEGGDVESPRQRGGRGEVLSSRGGEEGEAGVKFPITNTKFPTKSQNLND